ncbi:hypothetical protein [Parachryseolinea silvisoli]|uniref:hypothetical protein n=1 Tax=Parachryseolinea silvisoli TaxID=2873601 RepID=UPI002265DBE3|nr:hypothetical protein [Parachryseolinea silvisoli]MCD9017908.1 hypothetical protein [Parachryseolinea silvisoli]
MKDLEWFKKNISPGLKGYELIYKSFEEKGDFGFLSRVEFISNVLEGNVDFWSSGWLDVFVWSNEVRDVVLNVMLEPQQETEKDDLFKTLEKMLTAVD